MHLQLKFTGFTKAQEVTACFAFIQNGSAFSSFPLRRAAREATAFFLTTFTIITPSKVYLPLNFTTHTLNLQTDIEKVSDSVLSYLHPLQLNNSQLSSTKMTSNEGVPVLFPSDWDIYLCTFSFPLDTFKKYLSFSLWLFNWYF